MLQSSTAGLMALLTTYGYWAVLVFVAIESTGIPFPGETMLLVASIYAGTMHQLSLPLVIAAAATGAILGDNLGFWAGHEGGYRLLRRYGRFLRLDERKLKLGLYLFMRHGGKVVFFGRFFALLRMWAAFLAGTNRMGWKRFLLFNALGGMLWATLYGAGGYLLGDNVHRLTGPMGIVAIVLAVLTTIGCLVFVRRNERRLEEEAERALPGPLDAYQSVAVRDGALQDTALPRWPVQGKTRPFRSFRGGSSQERLWKGKRAVCAAVIVPGLFAWALGVYTLVSMHDREQASALLAAGALCLLVGLVGRYAKEGWSLLSRLPPLLLAGLIALGGLVPASVVAVLAVRTPETASALLSSSLPELTAEYHARAPVLLEVGVFCLLAGGAFIALILLSVKESRAGALP
jgi:membrane protein DedA with SNARE-associated domain